MVSDSATPFRWNSPARSQFDVEAHAVQMTSVDGFPIGGFVWRRRDASGEPRPVVIINSATSVRCRYYFRFAAFLFRHGFDVIVYDYRGIGESRPASLRGFNTSWLDWGCLDFEAVIKYAVDAFPGQPIDVIAHSIGGLMLGLAPSNGLINSAVTVGAQYAHWRDYARHVRARMFLKWHLFMPLVTECFGYFPGKRMGWLEDTPKGIVRDWAFGSSSLEGRWRRRFSTGRFGSHVPVRQFQSLTAPLLAISLTDDPFGTEAAVERLLSYFDSTSQTHLRLISYLIGETGVGHFGFFDSRFADNLWRIPLTWLQTGQIPTAVPGRIV
ncbi:MAG: alpha/beta fold hydrolase [Rhodobacteraceae bacterium]|nr:alpha/beta fold hydrolase [Paracoccaceae bacterium]